MNAGNQGENAGNAGNQGEDDRNAGNQGGNVGNQGGNDGNQGGNMGNQGGNVGNKGGNLRIGLELMNYNCGEGQEICVSCHSVNVQWQSSIGVLQKRNKFTGDHPCRCVMSIKLHSKNSSINLHFWEC